MKTSSFLWAAALLATTVPALPVRADTPALAPDANAQTVTLRYKFTPGQSRAYHFTMDSDGALTRPQGQPFPIKQHMEAMMHQTVKSVDDKGAATIATSFDSVSLTMNGQPVPMQNAAAMPPPTTIVMTPTGKIVSVQAPPSTPAMGPGMGLNNLMMFHSNSTLPEGPVKVGDKWDSTVDVAAMGLKVTAANVLTSADATVAKFTTTMTGTLASGTGAAFAALPVSLSGTMSGTSDQTFDVNAGALASQTGNVSMDLTIRPKQAPAGGGAAPNAMPPMKMQMKIKTQMDQVLSAPKPASAIVPRQNTLSAPLIRVDVSKPTAAAFNFGQPF